MIGNIQNSVAVQAQLKATAPVAQNNDLSRTPQAKGIVSRFLSKISSWFSSGRKIDVTPSNVAKLTKASVGESKAINVKTDSTAVVKDVKLGAMGLDLMAAGLTAASIGQDMKAHSATIKRAEAHKEIAPVSAAAQEVILHTQLAQVRTVLEGTYAVGATVSAGATIAGQVTGASTAAKTVAEGVKSGIAAQAVVAVAGTATGFVSGLMSTVSLARNVYNIAQDTKQIGRLEKAIQTAATPAARRVLESTKTMVEQNRTMNGVKAVKNAIVGTSSGLALAVTFGATAAAIPIVGWALLGVGLLVGIGIGIYNHVQQKKADAARVQRETLVTQSTAIHRSISALRACGVQNPENMTVVQLADRHKLLSATIREAKATVFKLERLRGPALSAQAGQIRALDSQVSAMMAEHRALTKLMDSIPRSAAQDTTVGEIQTSLDDSVVDAMHMGLQRGDVQALREFVRANPTAIGQDNFFGVDLHALGQVDDGKLFADWMRVRAG